MVKTISKIQQDEKNQLIKANELQKFYLFE